MPETSWSRIKLARRCWAAHDYKYNQRLRRKKKAAPLLRGEIFHKMLDARAEVTFSSRAKPPHIILGEYQETYRKLFLAEQEMYGATFIEDIARVYDGYDRQWQGDRLEYEGSEDFVAVNITPDIRFIGYLDKRVVDKDGRRWLMEHKSHRYIPNEEARFSDLQTVLYVWAWNQQYPKRAIEGIIWDYLRTKPPTIPEALKSGQLSQAKNIDTDYYTYVMAIRANNLNPRQYRETLDRLKSQGQEKFYQRIRLPNPSKAMVESVVKDARDTAVMIESLGKTVKTRNMTKDCASQCEYYRICQAELRGLDANFVRKADYEEKEPIVNDKTEEEA